MTALFKPPGPDNLASRAPTAVRQFAGDQANLLPFDDNPVGRNPTAPRVASYLKSANGFDTPQTKNTASQESDSGGPKQEKDSAPNRSDPAGSVGVPTVLSDADPDFWFPGAKYAQNLTRRGGGLQWRELSPLEGMRVLTYDHAFKTLRELEPNHPQLRSMSTSTWVPTFQDSSRLNEVIARIKAERGLSELESHHNFARQFAPNFRACGIEPDDYQTYLPRSFHRLRPDRLHTAPTNWNAQWRQYLTENQNAQPEKLFEQLHNMWKQIPWLDR
jgi:Predicted lipoprotein of unknown function (DUF2380)